MSSAIRIGNGGFAPAPLNPYTISGAVSVGDAVYLVPGSALTVARADANDAAKRPPIGIVAGISGSTAQVAGSGAVASGLAGLTVGSVYYLDTTPGGITTTVPASDIYILGVAISTSQILVGTVPKDLVGGGGGASSLQDAYDGGATITTSGGTDLVFTLTDGAFEVEGGGHVAFGGTTPLDYFNATATNLASLYGGSVELTAVGGGLQGYLDIDAALDLSINSAGGAINVGNDANAQPINVGTGSAARKVTIGNTTGASEVEINTGTVGFDVNALGPIALDGVGASNLTAASGNLTLSTTTSGTVALSSAGTLTFSDQYRASSTFSTAMPFASNSTEWDTFESNYGQVSLLNAINQAAGGGGGSTPYDVSAEFSGVPSSSVKIMNFVSARAWTLSSSGSAARCLVAPGGTTTFSVQKNDVEVGTIQYSVAGGLVGTPSITGTAFAAGDRLTVVSPATVNDINTPYFTLAGTV
jgi:hypothetical protein